MQSKKNQSWKLQETDEEWIIRSIQKLLDIQDTEETLFWNAVALNNLAQAYSDDEPDYDTYVVKEPNVNNLSHPEFLG